MAKVVERSDPSLHGLDGDLGGDLIGRHPTQRFGHSPSRRHKAQASVVVRHRLADPGAGDPDVADRAGAPVHRDNDVDEPGETHALNPMQSSSRGTTEQPRWADIELRSHGRLVQAKTARLDRVNPGEK